MSGLGLVPNEVVGYRIKPDWYSFNVVLVKRHGPGSKKAGQEYETTLAYCKSLSSAVHWIVSHHARVQGSLNQDDLQAATGSVADAKALEASFEGAVAKALQAVAELEARIKAAGLLNKHLVQALGNAQPDDSDAGS